MSKSTTLKGGTKMNIKFKNKNTVVITKSLGWSGQRPAPDQKVILKKNSVVEEFKKQHPDSKVESIAGPDSISNFRSKENSSGEWIIKLKDAKKEAVTKPPVKAPTQQAEVKEKTQTVASTRRHRGKKNKSSTKGA